MEHICSAHWFILSCSPACCEKLGGKQKKEWERDRKREVKRQERRREHSKRDRHQSSLSCPIWHHISLCVCVWERTVTAFLAIFILYFSYQSFLFCFTLGLNLQSCVCSFCTSAFVEIVVFHLFFHWRHVFCQKFRLVRT